MTPRRRFTVIGIDRGTGRESRVVITAGSLGEVERLAEELALEVRSIELDVVGEEARLEDPMTAPAPEEPARGPTSGTSPALPRAAPMPPATPHATAAWVGSPSPWLNFWWWMATGAVVLAYAVILLFTVGLAWLLFPIVLAPLLVALVKWLDLRLTRYELDPERLRVTSGILTKRTEHVELYRVKDTELTIPIWERIVGIGTINVVSSDATNPRVSLRGIRDPEKVREAIRTACEGVRRARGVRELDVS